MAEFLAERFRRRLPAPHAPDSDAVPAIVDAILSGAREAAATDVHLSPSADGLEMAWRVDGILQRIAQFAPSQAPKIVARLKVLSQLLTYRCDVPQEGRLRDAQEGIEIRISTFPTLFGERAVIRLFVGSGRYRRLSELGMPAEVAARLEELLGETGGLILLTGPAGSGKTTTVYACLRELVDKTDRGRSLVSLEDPIEVVVPGVSQSQVNLVSGLTLETGLKSLLRQDPEVMMVGEIRDRATAEMVFQASLTGHLVLTTFHAGSAAGAISRLIDMGIEPYLLQSGILAILCQRLLRKLCVCAGKANRSEDLLGLALAQARLPVGCERCGGTGYAGRIVVTELLLPGESELGRAILSRGDAAGLEKLAVAAGMRTQFSRALEAAEQGLTSPAEIRRVFGFAKFS